MARAKEEKIQVVADIIDELQKNDEWRQFIERRLDEVEETVDRQQFRQLIEFASREDDINRREDDINRGQAKLDRDKQILALERAVLNGSVTEEEATKRLSELLGRPAAAVGAAATATPGEDQEEEKTEP